MPPTVTALLDKHSWHALGKTAVAAATKPKNKLGASKEEGIITRR
jgi:tRNA A37 N6-isopentenylltransferase MiaA